MRWGICCIWYYGKTIGTGDLMQLYPRTDRGFSPDYYAYRTHRGVSPDLLPQEYTGCNVGDFRLSCLTVADSRGAFGADFTYVSHTVEAGKYQLTGLPCAHAEENDAETLIVRMQDEATGLTLELLYGVFAQQDVITRAARLTNHGDTPLRLDKAASACLDLPFGRWDLLHFHGRHAMERQLEREAVGTNIQTISSVRGSSSHHNNPFLILCQQDATETSGSCYGVMMVYSGSYQMDVERSQTGLVRVVSGIQEERFAWNLKPGETFDTPEVILSFAAEGLTPLSQQYHRFLRRNICRGPWKDKRRPVLINNWEATYFDFNTEKIVKIAEKAASLGVEMMVLDDGWFGTRNDDNQGLGDWTVNCEKAARRTGPADRADQCAGHEIRPVDRTGNGQRELPAVPHPSGLGADPARTQACHGAQPAGAGSFPPGGGGLSGRGYRQAVAGASH